MRTVSGVKALGRRLVPRAARISSVCPEKSTGGLHLKDSNASSQLRCFQPLFFRSTLLPRGALAMARRPIAVFPTLQMERGFSSSEVRVAEATGGIVEIPLAQTGEGIADCELIRWFVSQGDMVDEFAPVCEVQSDKASVVITSRYKGRVSQILHQPGDIVKVGDTLLELMLLEGSAAAEADTLPQSQTPSTSSPTSSSMSSDPEPPNPKTTEEEDEDSHQPGGAVAVLATPAVRALARDYGLDLHDVAGSGTDGRITKADVLHAVTLRENAQDDIQSLNEAPEVPEVKSSSVPQEYPPLPQGPSHGTFDGADTCIPVRGHRRAMARAMTAAAAVPHFHYVEEMQVGSLAELRRSLSEQVPLEAGVKLTLLPFLIKALSVALKKFPVMNSTVDDAVTEIHVRAAHNIGIAMATNHGLVVPNIKNVQRLSVLGIATEISRLIQLANTNSLTNEDITGGTITVSNFGAIGGKFGMPTLNVPEVAIVAIGRMQRVDDGHVIHVTWGADHRVIDGATVAHFCNEWKLLLEQPERLLLTLH